MVTIDQVWQQINALPDRFVFYTRKEINYLPKILVEGESIVALTSGFVKNRTWLCVCTNRRILFLDRGLLWGFRQVQMNLDRIQAIDSRHTIFFGSIRVWDGASAFEVGLVPKSSIAPFVRATQHAMDRYKREMVHDIVGQASAIPNKAPAPSPAHADAWLGELERLAQLKAAGHLTEIEFTTAKAKLLTKG